MITNIADVITLIVIIAVAAYCVGKAFYILAESERICDGMTKILHDAPAENTKTVRTKTPSKTR